MTEVPVLVVVSGVSGAGRTTVVKTLEDLGFYCVDNLPVVLLEPFVDLFSETASRLAVVIDVRERGFLDAFPEVYERLRARDMRTELVFLDAADETISRRYDETRRVHPAGGGRPLSESISQERDILAPIAARADLALDTSAMTAHDLKRFVTRRYTGASRSGSVEVDLVSFGYRYGTLESADLMIDVRFLANPHFEPALRDQTGLDPEVARYVLEHARTKEFLNRLVEFLEFMLPLYDEEGKAYLTIGIGCTGGQHRSVAVVGALEKRLDSRKIKLRVRHRDVERQRRTMG